MLTTQTTTTFEACSDHAIFFNVFSSRRKWVIGIGHTDVEFLPLSRHDQQLEEM